MRHLRIEPLSSSPHTYAPSSRLTGVLVALLVAQVGTEVLLSVLDAVSVALYPQFDDPNADFEDAGEMLLGLVYFLAGLLYLGFFVASIVLFCKWAHHANRNARALGAEDMEFTPGWTVGWFFVPFFNLFKPYRAIREIYQASEPVADPDGWHGAEVPSFLGNWWGFWLLTNFLGTLEMRFYMREGTGSAWASMWLGAASTAASVVAVVLLIRVIRAIEERQERKSELLAGAMSSRVAEDASRPIEP